MLLLYLIALVVSIAASQQVGGNGDYYYTGDNHYVGYHGSQSTNRGFSNSIPFRVTPLPSYQQQEYLQPAQPSAYQLPPTYDPYVQTQVQNQVRSGQSGFHTNQHLPQPFHPPSRLPIPSGEQSLDYPESLVRSSPGSPYQEIVRHGGTAPSYQQPPSRPPPTGPSSNYQEIVRSTGTSFPPHHPSALIDQLDSNRWRTPGGIKRKQLPTVALPPLAGEADGNALPAVSSTAGYFSAAQNSIGRDLTTPSIRGRSRYNNVRVESTPFTFASNTINRSSRTRRPAVQEMRRVTTVRPSTIRPSSVHTTPTTTTTTTTSTTETPHYDPDYELEYILEPEDEGLQEELPALLGPSSNLSLPIIPQLLPNLKFEEDVSAAFLPPDYKKDSKSTTSQQLNTTFTHSSLATQGTTKSPSTFRLPLSSTVTTTQQTMTPLSSSTVKHIPKESAAVTPEPDSQPESPTESWVIVASVQTSRSVSGARFLPGPIVKQEETPKPLSLNKTMEKNNDVTDPPITQSTPSPTSSSTKSSTESIIDKLDRVQSELSSGILNGFRPGDSKLVIPGMLENKTFSEPTIKSSSAVPFTTFSTETLTTPTTTTTELPKPRSLAPSGKRTTLKPKKSLLDSIQYDELGSSLLPPGFKVRESSFKPKPSGYNSREGSGRSAGSTFKNSVKSDKSSQNKTLESILGKITFEDVSSLLPPGYNSPEKADNTPAPKVPKQDVPASLLPPGFKPGSSPEKSETSGPGKVSLLNGGTVPDSLLPPVFKKGKSGATDEKKSDPLESILKKVQFKDVSSLLPAGFKERESSSADLAGLLSPSFKANNTESDNSTSTNSSIENGKVVFPSRPGGPRKPLPSRTKSAGGLAPPPPKIQKGWPVRASTEFTGWPSSSTTPITVEKILQQARKESAKILEFNRLATSTEIPSSTRESITTTTRTTTVRQPTTPGICEKDCDMAATLRLVAGAKWVPELLDHNTLEWQQLANEVERELEAVYSSSDSLSRWYKKITIDAFSEGSVLVDYFVELTELGRTVNTAEMKRLFHESLAKYTSTQAALVGDTRAALGVNSNQTEYKLGKFAIDPHYTDFIVLPRQVVPTVGYAEEDELLPQWAIAVIVIGLASLLFVIIFGVTVLVNRHKSAKKKQPTVLTEDMLSELNKNHMGGLDNFGADDLYNMEDVWSDKPVTKRSSGSIQENSMANLYDSWRSEWNGYYYNAYYGNGSNGGYGLGRRRSDYDTNF